MSTLTVHITPELRAVLDEDALPGLVSRFLQAKQTEYNASARAGWRYRYPDGAIFLLDMDGRDVMGVEDTDPTKYEIEVYQFGLDADKTRLLGNAARLELAALDARKMRPPYPLKSLADYFKWYILVPAFQYAPEKSNDYPTESGKKPAGSR